MDMSMQMDLGRAALVKGGGSPAPVDPDAAAIAIFGSTAGFMFDPAVLTSLFKTSAAGTPDVSADSDPVGKNLDLSPNAFHRLQATAASRPLYKTNGVLSWLLYQGTDDYLRNTVAQLPLTDFYYCDVIEEISVLANAGVLVVTPATGNDYARADGLVFSTSNKNTSKFESAGASGTSFLLVESSPAGTLAQKAVREIIKVGGTASLYVNGSLIATDSSFTAFNALSAAGFFTGARFIGGALAGPYLIGREYFRYFLGRAPTNGERTIVTTLAALRGGL